MIIIDLGYYWKKKRGGKNGWGRGGHILTHVQSPWWDLVFHDLSCMETIVNIVWCAPFVQSFMSFHETFVPLNWYIYIYTHTHTHVLLQFCWSVSLLCYPTSTKVCMHSICVCVHVHACVRVCIRVHTHACVHSCERVCCRSIPKAVAHFCCNCNVAGST